LNIAEGAGEFSKPDEARFYRFTRRSATECAAALDVAVRLELANPAQCEAGREILIRIVSMLTKLVRALERRAGRPGTGTGAGAGAEQGAENRFAFFRTCRR
jgi:hypothetical protein